MGKIGFLLPWHSEKSIRQAMGVRSDVAYLKCSGFFDWTIDNKVLLRGNPLSRHNLINYSFALSEIKRITPIFARHHDFMPYQELIFRQAALTSLQLAEEIRKENFLFIYFGYESSHHLHTYMLELACRITKIPQVFEFALPNNRSTFFLQTQGIETRKLFSNTSVRLHSSDSNMFDQEVFAAQNLDRILPKRTTSFAFGLLWFVMSTPRGLFYRYLGLLRRFLRLAK